MRRILTAILVAAFGISSGLLLGCGEQKEKKEPAKTSASSAVSTPPASPSSPAPSASGTSAPDKVSGKSEGQKGEYQQKMEAALAEYGKKIKELEAKAANMTGESKAAIATEMENLKKQEKAFSDKLAALKSAAGTGWEEIKKQVDQSLLDLKKAYDAVASHIK